MNGKEKALEIWKKAVSIFNTDKKIKWIVLIGMIGILLILLSEILPQNTKTPQDAVSVSIDNETFCRQTEAKIQSGQQYPGSGGSAGVGYAGKRGRVCVSAGGNPKHRHDKRLRQRRRKNAAGKR